MKPPWIIHDTEGTKPIIIPDVPQDEASIETERYWLSIGLQNNLIRESIGTDIMKLIERIPN